MNTILEQKKTAAISIVTILFFLACILLLGGWLNQFFYLVPILIAITALTFAFSLSIHRKRVVVQNVALLMVGVLFLASGVVTYAYDTAILPLSIDAQINFSRFINTNDINLGLIFMTFGYFQLSLVMKERKLNINSFFPLLWSTVQQAIQDINTVGDSPLFPFVLGLLFFLFGLLKISNGLPKIL